MQPINITKTYRTKCGLPVRFNKVDDDGYFYGCVGNSEYIHIWNPDGFILSIDGANEGKFDLVEVMDSLARASVKINSGIYTQLEFDGECGKLIAYPDSQAGDEVVCVRCSEIDFISILASQDKDKEIERVRTQ